MLKADCHIHMVLDGANWKNALQRHSCAPDENWIRSILSNYRSLGYTYLRDGGDRWGVGLKARTLSREYGICYRTPAAPLCQAGHYGGFIGLCYANEKEYCLLVQQAKEKGADFIKLMISGLMDFNQYGVLTEPALPPRQIRQLIHIAHEEGFSVMVHANGTQAVVAAAEANVESVEHGAYLQEEALFAMAQAGAVWVPTLSTIGNLRCAGRFDDTAVARILQSALENVSRFASMGGLLASGTDAGAWNVPHGCQTEEALLQLAGITPEQLQPGIRQICKKF